MRSMARSRLEATGSTGWTTGGPGAGISLLERWTQVKEGVGQVVLLSGEAGIGKSRLVQVLQEQVATEPQAWLTPCQCSPYYQHTALYPWIELLERVVLRFEREEAPPQKLRKLEGFVVQYGLPLAEVVPLFAALLSLPLSADYAPLHLSPEQQKRQTLQALLTILLKIAAQQPVLFVMEDLHWVDSSTLELLSLLVDQGPTARILALLTFRPDFSPPWTGRSHLTQVTLHRLPSRQTMEVIYQVGPWQHLCPRVVEQIVAKTDGVPLFVEELTKMVLESGLLQEQEALCVDGSLAPAGRFLHAARLADGAAGPSGDDEGLAQLCDAGARARMPCCRRSLPGTRALHQGLHQLVEAEFCTNGGAATGDCHLFKHALIQDAAYQSLLRAPASSITSVLRRWWPSGFPRRSRRNRNCWRILYRGRAQPRRWSTGRAGKRASERSAYVEDRSSAQRVNGAQMHGHASASAVRTGVADHMAPR